METGTSEVAELWLLLFPLLRKKKSNFWLELSLENVKLGNIVSYEKSFLESGKPSTNEEDFIKKKKKK